MEKPIVLGKVNYSIVLFLVLSVTTNQKMSKIYLIISFLFAIILYNRKFQKKKNGTIQL